MTDSAALPDVPLAPPKRRRWPWWLGGTLTVLLLLGAAGFWLVKAGEEVVLNAYAVWWTADLTIAHLEGHGGAWPRNWEELRATAQTTYQGTTSTNRDGTMIAEFRPRADIEELQWRVVIDFTADPQELVKAAQETNQPPFRVIRLRNGKSTHYSGKEPNAMILEYLAWKQRQPTP